MTTAPLQLIVAAYLDENQAAPERQRQRGRIDILLVVGLALPLGGAGIWFALTQVFG